MTDYNEMRLQLEMIDDFIEKAYEGMVIINEFGIITKFKYEKVLGIKEKDALGKHITEVIDTTRLHRVLKTGKSEIGNIQRVNGKVMITSRIPIRRQGKIVGAIGTIMFKNVSDVNCMYENVKGLRSISSKQIRITEAKYEFDDILTQDYYMKHLIANAKRAAKTHATICITGESGTGKEYFAHSIHNGSNRKYGPFVELNCGAIPNELMESELFGYDAGAFTGASKNGKIGKFEFANGGTIFLDEIGTMPLEMQSKLLRVLEEKEFERIGGNKRIDVDVRVISATNENLKKLVSEGKFREDLYYRLHVVSLEIPPLRERNGDISLLSKKILKDFCETYESCPKGFSRESLVLLENYHWPGNVRELRNCIESSIAMSEQNLIQVKDLPNELRRNDESSICSMDFDLKHSVEAYEVKLIKSAIKQCLGNKSKASKLLGLHRSALYKKIDKFGINS